MLNKIIKIGFYNLTVPFFISEEETEFILKYVEDTKNYIKGNKYIELIDSNKIITTLEEAREEWKFFKKNDVDAVIIFNGTFSLGNLTAEIVRNLECPYLLWGIEECAPKSRKFTGSMVGLLPETVIFKNFGKKFSFIYGSIKEKEVQEKFEIFVKAVRAKAFLEEAKIGVVGMRPDGFEISDFDELSIKKIFGTTIIKISMYYLSKVIKEICEEDIEKDVEVQKAIWNIKKEDLIETKGLSRVYLAMKRIVKEFNLHAYAPDCWPELRDEDITPICPANARLSTEGIMASCECDVNGALTLLLQHVIANKPAWLADFTNFDKKSDSLLFWHGGNAPCEMVKNKSNIERVFGGLAQTNTFKSGVATVVRLSSIRGDYIIHAGIGEVLEEEPVLKGSNLFIKMKGGNKEFVESLIKNGVPHHNGIVYGDIIAELKEFANLMNLPIILL